MNEIEAFVAFKYCAHFRSRHVTMALFSLFDKFAVDNFSRFGKPLCIIVLKATIVQCFV